MRAIAIACVLGLVPTLALATTIVSEDFESYADSAALGGTWALGDGTLDTGFGNPGQSLFHPGTATSFSGGNTNSISLAGVYPGPNEALILTGDIYDDGANENKRTTIGIRGPAGILEMGMYNNPSHYAIRSVLFASAAPGPGGYAAFPDAPPFEQANGAVEGWHTFQAIITDSDVTFTLDLQGDGSIESTLSFPLTAAGAGGFTAIRLGGPSDVSSGGGGVFFDNISLTLVPEPTSAVIALLGVAGLAARRRG